MLNDIRNFETVRVVFSKRGNAKYISHLDLNRTMIRTIRRADLPIWYTEGFNRHPYVTFVAPLSLGYESVYELMDFRLCEEMEYDLIVDRLNQELPEGIRAISAGPAVNKVGLLDAARYQILTPISKEKIEQFLQQETIFVEKKTKKGDKKTIDIRPFIKDCDMQSTESGTIWNLTLPCNSTETINPSLVVEAIQKSSDREKWSICRLKLFLKDGNIFI